ncbi:MAG: flagellar type III secretion system pore protein FliP [Proteobacteria bacterium]|nr:flagellar type III secretion system pore protein FliP [Pseudomonadota bacterium]
MNPPFRKLSQALILFTLYVPAWAHAQGLPAFTATPVPGGATEYTLSLQTLLFMTVLVFLPAMLLMMTAFTRIVIVMSLLKQALGTTTVPPSQVIIGLSLFLTFFVMNPVLSKINDVAIKPLMDNQISMMQALDAGSAPLKTFMLSQTRQDDLALFVRLSGNKPLVSPADTPMTLLIPAFVTSELKTAFQIGFIVFIPFLIIDMVVAAVLMSMGMMMLSPVTVSFPLKLMLFVLVNGWELVIGSLVQSFVH